MPFISSAQKALLSTRLIAGVPSVSTEEATLIAGIICDWLEQDAIPTLLVSAGIAIAGVGGGVPGPVTGATIAPGKVT